MITSTSNAQVKQLLQLQKRSRERAQQDVFVVEGIKMYQEVPRERLVHTYISESFSRSGRLRAETGPVTVLSDRVFECVSDTKTPQGVLCLVRQFHYTLEDLLRGSNGTAPLILALENLQDPGNLGTILRTAEGAGVTGLLLSADCVDLYNPKVIRSTMGSVYRVPFVCAKDWRSALEELARRGVALYAAHLQGADWYDSPDYRTPCAFLIGNESRGLSEETAALAGRRVRIPMYGRVESLNAAVAAAVLMYEASRQRRA